jgi:hypothetical protein
VRPRLAAPARRAGRGAEASEGVVVEPGLPGDARPVHRVVVQGFAEERVLESPHGAGDVAARGAQQAVEMGVARRDAAARPGGGSVERRLRGRGVADVVQRQRVEQVRLRVVWEALDQVGSVQLRRRVVVAALQQVFHLPHGVVATLREAGEQEHGREQVGGARRGEGSHGVSVRASS